MNTRLRPTRIRRSLTILATIVAATGILVAVPVHAGKAAPTLHYVDGSVFCGGSLSGADFTVAGGKGRWVHVTTDVKVGTGDWSSGLGMETARVDLRSGDPFGPDTNIGNQSGNVVVWRARLVDRKGTDLPDVEPAVSSPVVCQ